MPITDNRTANLNLPLPDPNNLLSDDVLRLQSALNTIDSAIAGKQPELGFTPENTANKGAANGYASLDGAGKVPAAQLPSYVDDVIEGASLSAFPATGEAGKIYLAVDTGYTYRWGGTSYVQIGGSPIGIATASTLGLIRVGNNLSIDPSTGVLSADLSGTTNVVVDQFTGTGSQTAFTLSGSPGTINNTFVYVGGVYQRKALYTVTGTTLTFSVAPPSGQSIEVVFYTPIAIGTPADGTVTEAKLASKTGTGAVVLATGATMASVRGNTTTPAALDLDCSTTNTFLKTINGNSTFTFSNAPASGTAFSFTLELTHTSGSVTWPASVQWPGGTAPALTTGKVHLFVFSTTNGGSTWRGAPLTNYAA